MNIDLTPAQARVGFHQDRLLRSTGTHPGAVREYLVRCFAAGLPEPLADMTREQCVMALQCLEAACRVAGLHHFRDVRTGWEAL